MRIRFKNIGWLTLAPVLLSSLWTAGCGSSQQSEASIVETPPAALAVSLAPALSKEVPLVIETTGDFRATESSNLAPDIPGRIVATPVDIGAYVKQGQIIARLDDREAALRLQQAQASLQQAEAQVRQAESRIGMAQDKNFEASTVPEVQAANAAYESALAQARLAQAESRRYQELAASGDVSRSTAEQRQTQAETAEAQANAARQQYEAALNTARQSYQGISTAEAGLAAVRAQVAMAQKALQDTTVRAPFAGHVSSRPIAVGEYVMASSTVATIVQIDPIQLDLRISEADAARIQNGMSVKASAAAFPGREFLGRVTAINPSIDPSSRAMTVEARFDNPDNLLRPGMFATTQILLPASETAIFIPEAALVSEPDTNSHQVFILENGRARVRVVQPGRKSEGMVRILAGLEGGEVVVTSHLSELFDGAPVESAVVTKKSRQPQVERKEEDRA